jgi:hypothetical protein
MSKRGKDEIIKLILMELDQRKSPAPFAKGEKRLFL